MAELKLFVDALNNMEPGLVDIIKSFVYVDKDIIDLYHLGITNYNEGIKTFIKEMKEYFEKTWNEYYRQDLEMLNEDSTIDDFMYMLIKDSEITTYEILEDSFLPGEDFDEYFKILSKNTKIILDYYFGIAFHDKD